ncbi:Spx/MgsR family RNA polymerase-binding regulatory protein [Sporolactobacillus spathodeae]|uniref:Arsenate reductase n=1 Tax=Sporolactobacillus spathodeae TaxID=1465502 RepID=A0ABS2Q4G8_9BACL|nr:Spx/MgsR family RNA polymerase-binding regulatory protein [Sporolactobacillus spathodeae]MBM7656596.1 arsenate reductase [Sporolactobacillus spathodeae]
MLKIYCYPTCGTCKKAKKWLDAKKIAYDEIQIADNPPTKEELRQFQRASGLPLKKFFNTSGKHYRDKDIKNKLKVEPEEKWLDWLAEDGMLLKRPLAVADGLVTVGFDEAIFEKSWGRKTSKN